MTKGTKRRACYLIPQLPSVFVQTSEGAMVVPPEARKTGRLPPGVAGTSFYSISLSATTVRVAAKIMRSAPSGTREQK